MNCFWCGRELLWSDKVQAWGFWCEARGRRWFETRCQARVLVEVTTHEPSCFHDDAE